MDLAQYSHTPSLRGAGFEDEDEDDDDDDEDEATNHFPNPDWLPTGDSYIFTLTP